MESQAADQTPDEINPKLCVNCHLQKYEEGYPIKLCADCRHKLINYPIPEWIKLFALGVLAVIVLSLVRTQSYIAVAIHLGRGEKAMDQKLYVTAQREIALVLAKFPDNVTANGDMIIASAYNLDIDLFNKTVKKIGGEHIDDEELLGRITMAMTYVAQSNPKDTITVKKLLLAGGKRDELLKLKDQIDTLNNDPAIKTFLADRLYDVSEYTMAERLLDSVLITDPEFIFALRLSSATKRNLGKYSEALECCDRMLGINKEDTYALGQKTKIELKQKNDYLAAVYARQAIAINPADDSALEAMAMVDHFAGRNKQSRAALTTLAQHAAATRDSTILNRLTPIINGSENYR